MNEQAVPLPQSTLALPPLPSLRALTQAFWQQLRDERVGETFALDQEPGGLIHEVHDVGTGKW